MSIIEKKISESVITMRQIVMPEHANALNTIFGGVVMSWIDIAAAMCATKHCAKPVVTAHVDEISFLSPIKIGSHVCIKASINYVGRTSMEVGVKVLSENPYTGEVHQTTRAYLTFVALNEHGKPTQAPQIIAETQEEKRRYANAQKRVENRKSFRSSIKAK